MFPYPSTLYACWRLQGAGVSAVRESENVPPEKLLQAVWQHQRLLREHLKTLDGRTVRVLHPGFLNHGGGPDFRGAVIQFGDAPAVSGDVEVDLYSQGWHAHGHDKNPAFKNVILHVIWSGEKSGDLRPPQLLIRASLDAPLAELGLWLNSETVETLPENYRGQCSAPLRALAPEKLSELLQQASQIRFRAKAAQFSARARQAGWEQSLWEGLFRALGYQHNSWPMLLLAEQRLRWLSPECSATELQSRLLGIANLLPGELSRAQISADTYVRRVWDQWWRERETYAECAVPRSLWRTHGQRPANHPQRRLALAAHWLTDDGLLSGIEHWCAEDLPDSKLAPSLHHLLKNPVDEFWSWHWTLRSPRLKTPQALLGTARVTDLAVNVILPWLWSRAVEGENSRLQNEIERRYHRWPAAEDNGLLRLVRQRLLGGVGRQRFTLASQQQGLLQIVRDFCDNSNAVCDRCRFPELVRQFNP